MSLERKVRRAAALGFLILAVNECVFRGQDQASVPASPTPQETEATLVPLKPTPTYHPTNLPVSRDGMNFVIKSRP